MASLLSGRAPAPFVFEPPPRNPRRLRSRHITVFAPVQEERRSTSSRHLDQGPASTQSRPREKGPLSRLAPPTVKLAAQFACERAALSQISPPSSPEDADGEYAPIYEQVSPVEDDGDLLSPVYCMTGQAQQSARQGDAKPGAFKFPSADGYSAELSAPRSPQMQFASLKAFKSAERPASSSGQAPRQQQQHQQHELPYVPPLAIPQKSSRRASPAATPTVGTGPSLGSPISPVDSPVRDRDALSSTKLRRPATLATPPSRPVHASDALLDDDDDDAAGLDISQHAYPTPPSTGPSFRVDFRAQSPPEALSSPNAARAVRRKPAPIARRAVSGEGSQPQGLSAPETTTRRASTPAWAANPSPEPLPKNAAAARLPERASPSPHAPSPAEAPAPSSDEAEPAEEAHDEAPEQEDGNGDEEEEEELTDEQLAREFEARATFNRPFSTVGPSRPRPRTLAGIRSHIRAKGSLDFGLRPASILFIDKPLPLAPPELVSLEDRIAHLHAVLSGLALRRLNIARGIKQMTELMPLDTLLRKGDILERRESEKRKLEGLRDELAEVQRLQHDLGLKLHRAYKRQERESMFEPTTLWVRRRDVG